jgi:hypothetical protein
MDNRFIKENFWKSLLLSRALYTEFMHQEQRQLSPTSRMSRFERFFSIEYFSIQYNAIYTEISAWRECVQSIEDNPGDFEAWYNSLQELVTAHFRCAKLFKLDTQHVEYLFNTVEQAYNIDQELDRDTDPYTAALLAIINARPDLELDSEDEEDPIQRIQHPNRASAV